VVVVEYLFFGGGAMKLHIEWGPEAPQKMTWYEGIGWCNSLGDGWRLPTIGELRIAYEQNVEGFAPDIYWSSSQYYSNYAWTQYFYNGYQHYYYKYSNLRVRACCEEAEAREAKE
jgi:hypothetical protein